MRQFRIRGQRRGQPTAAEINRWNKWADRAQRGKPEPPTAANYNPNSRVAFCKNVSGADRNQFECMSIVGMVYDLETDGSSGLVFELDTANATDPTAILTSPIANGQVGFAVVDGLALALVEGGTGTQAAPNPTTHKLQPASGSIQLLTAPHATDERLLAVVLNSGSPSVKLFKTPSGGIGAASGDGSSGTPYVWGSASCDEIDSSGETTGNLTTVKNIVSDTIGGNVAIKAILVGSDWIVDVASCP